MLNKNLYMMLLALLGLALTGCPTTGGDDDDSAAGDDDDSAAGDDDDSAAGDDDDSAAGDDDDSAPTPMPMDLTFLDVFCEGDPDLADQPDKGQAGQQAGQFVVTVEFSGYADNVWFWLWDGFQFQSAHFQDTSAPWALSNLNFTDVPGQETDTWGIGGGGDDAFGSAVPDLPIYQTIADAEANSGTIIDCYDANSQPNVEVHNYMVCATDFNDATNAQCYFCGEDLDNDVFLDGGVADNTMFKVGYFTDDQGTMDTSDDVVYQATVDVTGDTEACTLSSQTL